MPPATRMSAATSSPASLRSLQAKLFRAGLNLTAEDRPTTKSGPFYSIELVRAVTLAWLFSGQRSDEITRRPVGCIRWQHHGDPIAGDAD